MALNNLILSRFTHIDLCCHPSLNQAQEKKECIDGFWALSAEIVPWSIEQIFRPNFKFSAILLNFSEIFGCFFYDFLYNE